MAYYVSFINWTDQGIRNYKDTRERSKAATATAEKMGGKFVQLLWTMGPYDLVGITEFPDDDTATAFALAFSSAGNVRTTTMRAYDAAGMERILAKTR